MYLSIRNTVNLALSWLGERGGGYDRTIKGRSRDLESHRNHSKSHKIPGKLKTSPGNKFGEKDTLNAYLLAPQTYSLFFFWFWPFWHPKRVTRVTRHYRQKVPFFTRFLGRACVQPHSRVPPSPGEAGGGSRDGHFTYPPPPQYNNAIQCAINVVFIYTNFQKNLPKNRGRGKTLLHTLPALSVTSLPCFGPQRLTNPGCTTSKMHKGPCSPLIGVKEICKRGPFFMGLVARGGGVLT